MNTLRLVLGALLLTLAQIAPAIQITGAPGPSRSAPAAGEPIERGGRVDAVNPAKATITVDGASYAVTAGSVAIHPLSGATSSRLSELKPGMLIRFTTVQPYPSSPVQVREVWVTGVPRGKPRP